MNIYVDIDNTICNTEGSDYPNSTPRYKQIEKINKIRDHKQQIELLERELSTIQQKIVDNCSHQWRYESPAIYERGYYYCSICGKTK